MWCQHWFPEASTLGPGKLAIAFSLAAFRRSKASSIGPMSLRSGALWGTVRWWFHKSTCIPRQKRLRPTASRRCDEKSVSRQSQSRLHSLVLVFQRPNRKPGYDYDANPSYSAIILGLKGKTLVFNRYMNSVAPCDGHPISAEHDAHLFQRYP